MAVYLPFAQRIVNARSNAPEDMYVIARTAGDPATLAQSLRGIVASTDRSVAVSEVRTMNEVVSHSIAKPRFTMTLVAGFALTAVLLGVIGIYGVMSYVVSQRTREMRVRFALGAARGDVMWLVMRQAGVLVVSGVAIGLALAWLSGKLVRTYLYGVTPHDGWTLAAVAVTLIFAGAVAAYLPAQRAAGVDPVEALRAE